MYKLILANFWEIGVHYQKSWLTGTCAKKKQQQTSKPIVNSTAQNVYGVMP